MKYQIHITQRAVKDLDYIEFSLKNPQTADSLLDEAETVLAGLDQMPARYAVVDDRLLSAWGIRFIQIKKYLAFYVIADETRTVHIIRFLYGKSDWRSILRYGLTTE